MSASVPVSVPAAGPAAVPPPVPAGVAADGRSCLTTGTWVVDGRPDLRALRARVAARVPEVPLTVHDLVTGGADGTEWGELVREETAAAEVEPGPARVLLARLGEERFLLVVVTEDPLPPAAVLRWLLTDDTPFPAAGDAPEGPFADPAGAGSSGAGDAAAEPPAFLGNGRASGNARTLRVPAGPAVARLRATGVTAEAALAAAVALLLVRCGGSPGTALVVASDSPVAIAPGVTETESGAAALWRAGEAVASGVPVPPGFRAALALAAGGEPEPERIGAYTALPVRVPDAVAHHGMLVLLEGDRLRVDHDTGLYEETAVATFVQRLLAVLDGLLDDLPVHRIDGVTAPERTALDGWSRGAERSFPESCLHTLVEEHAARTPDAPAVLCGDTELTYRQLDEDANRVARQLRAAGVGPGRLVALLTERAAWSVTAMLGALKAGAAYVPIEPTYPPERIRHILADSGAVALLARRRPEFSVPVPVLPAEGAAGLPGTSPGVPVTPGDLAYVIYTSGSTGEPKGIGVHHRAIVASTAARAVAGPPPGRDLVLPPLCFDGAAGGMFWALTSGGAVVLPTETEAHDPMALRKLLEAAAVTHIHAVPSHYRIVLQVADRSVLSRFSMVAVGGEPLSPDIVTEHLRLCPDAPLFNDYGPTECSVWATTHRCGPAEAAGAAIPIGRPVPGYRAYVLDTRLRPVPPKVPGEIHLGGPGVAHGYHRRAALTAERFLPDPFEPGGRLYRTGDRGWWGEDGRLRILGRVDHQVKVRGFRIELGEVEAAVRRHPAVTDCAVLLRREEAGERLIAFVVLGAGATVSELREKIAETLPGPMRPDHITELPELPRTPGGKVDSLTLRTMAISGQRA
ncbi:amino acid adenylation domain-containing protein [Streptomyces sp. IB2014 016-6]|uniref:amino acid adenylation domain-containing protein n=1 Tax=Streptomyces sp. IB2014 016-6 TaxID=2517818 RepID=UPI0011CBBDFD|nr:amino acid adenylation domain-containing protein [Streptomyces sp. IB2014 016-6]TXL84351.1 amino acid adenylation domain-containing protein [Streptomyces sp. IB2014 016-6]